MLFSLLLANVRILLSFYFLLYSTKLAPAIPVGAPTTLTEETMPTLPLLAERTSETLSKQQHVYLTFYYIIFFD